MNPFVKKVLKPIFKAIASPGLGNPHTPFEVELMVAGIKPVAIINPEISFDMDSKVNPCANSVEEMKELIQTGKIIHIGDYKQPNIGLIQVFAQANKVKEGQELYARYYDSDESYPYLIDNERDARIGYLLGYTENDIAWVTGKKYNNPIAFWLMNKTEGVRRKMRRKYLLEYFASPK